MSASSTSARTRSVERSPTARMGVSPISVTCSPARRNRRSTVPSMGLRTRDFSYTAWASARRASGQGQLRLRLGPLVLPRRAVHHRQVLAGPGQAGPGHIQLGDGIVQVLAAAQALLRQATLAALSRSARTNRASASRT